MKRLLAGAGMMVVTFTPVLASTSGSSSGFNYLSVAANRRPSISSKILLHGELARSDKDTTTSDAKALVLLNEAEAKYNEAKALRAQASALQKQLDFEKEERIRKQREKVDSLIDALLFHGVNDNTPQLPAGEEDDEKNEVEMEKGNKQQLMYTEEQVASLLINKRMNYDMVNQMFDRIVELSSRPQSIDSCSPLLSLLLDAACKVDCLEKDANPNKRWNHRVERDLRRKLFALGYGIRIEDVDEQRRPRSITGDKDYS